MFWEHNWVRLEFQVENNTALMCSSSSSRIILSFSRVAFSTEAGDIWPSETFNNSPLKFENDNKESSHHSECFNKQITIAYNKRGCVSFFFFFNCFYFLCFLFDIYPFILSPWLWMIYAQQYKIDSFPYLILIP